METRSFAWRLKDRNWSKRRTLCIWEGTPAHKRWRESRGSDNDVERRIGLPRGTWQALGKVWKSKELSKAAKIRMYEVLVLNTLLYNAETWTLRERQKQRLRVFEMACLRKIEVVT